jgi:hypothetical protein
VPPPRSLRSSRSRRAPPRAFCVVGSGFEPAGPRGPGLAPVVVPTLRQGPTARGFRVVGGLRVGAARRPPQLRPLGAKRRGRSVLRGFVLPPHQQLGGGAKQTPAQRGRRGVGACPDAAATADKRRVPGSQPGRRAAAVAGLRGSRPVGRAQAARGRRSSVILTEIQTRSIHDFERGDLIRISDFERETVDLDRPAFGGAVLLFGGLPPPAPPGLPPPPRRSAPSGGVALDPGAHLPLRPPKPGNG